MKINVYTVVSSDRISDAKALLRNLSSFDNLKVNIIPFEDSTEDLLKLADDYNSCLVEPLPYWDELGKKIFGDHLYRPKVLAWKYFRKFNAISHSNGKPFLFLDANVLLASDPSFLFDKLKRGEIVFGARAMNNRNFTPWGKSLSNFLNSNIGEGFNAGFWGAIENPFKASVFDLFLENGGMIKPMLTLSPEQSVLSMAVAFSSVRPYLISELDSDYANLVSAESVNPQFLNFSNDQSLMLNKQAVIGIKWTGRNIVLPKTHLAEIFRSKFKEVSDDL